jgi:hypothetical protein
MLPVATTDKVPFQPSHSPRPMPLKPEQPEEGVAAHLFVHLAGQQVHGTGDRGERVFGHGCGGGWQQSPDPSKSIGPE